MDNVQKKKYGIGCLGLLVLFIIILMIIGSSGDDESQTPTETQTASEAQPAPEKPSFDWAAADVTENNIKSALAEETTIDSGITTDVNFPDDITEIQIIDITEKEGQKRLLITYKLDNAWDETDFVKKAAGTILVAGSQLFVNTKIEQITLISQTEMTDKYGKSELTDVASITLTRETADKIDWKGLAWRQVTDPGNMYRVADNYYIAPGILKDVKFDEVKF